jgi:hypothetical protein
MSETFAPPASVASAAKRALEWIADGKAGSGFTSAGRNRAGQLSRREGISSDTIMRMVSFFARHEVDKKAEGFNQGEKGFPSPGRVAWDAWGGDAGKSWAESVAAKLNKEKAIMTNDFATSYAEIFKYDKNDDGTLTVYGKATSDDLDIDNQICDNDWLSKAVPEWFKSGGNIREQHSSIAAGVATEYEQKGDGFYVEAKIVDPNSIRKVEHKVLKGFSIGIKGPRVIRDNKAANGRIVDGQIVELSLVDRPANPTCQLVLAKSVGGESTLTQVEELIEKKTDYEAIIPERKGSPADKDLYAAVIADAKSKFDVYPSAVANAWVSQEYKKRGGKYSSKEKSTSKEIPVAKSVLAETILELVKSANGETVKFDQASYDTARRALAQLIITEAGEMADGSDERDDIEELIDAIKHLFRWKDGEDEEGETNDMSGSVMEMSAKEADADCECDGCAACKADGGCDKTPCMKCAMAKSASIDKCLQCGCGMPGQDHGLTTVQIPGNNSGISTTANVSTATIITPEQNAGSIKSAEGEESAVAEEAATNDILDESAVAEIVEKAVKSATESVKAEIASLQAATKAAEEKAVALESELVTAKSAAVSGGPKRTGRIAVTQTNELLLKAAEYKAKAAATSDPILVKGYKSLEKEFLSKAGKPVDQD